jgi:hypothetical protein
MSSALEVSQGVKAHYGEVRLGEEAEGLVETGRAGSVAAAAQQKASYQDDEGVLPVILEDYLERAGIM